MNAVTLIGVKRKFGCTRYPRRVWPSSSPWTLNPSSSAMKVWFPDTRYERENILQRDAFRHMSKVARVESSTHPTVLAISVKCQALIAPDRWQRNRQHQIHDYASPRDGQVAAGYPERDSAAAAELPHGGQTRQEHRHPQERKRGQGSRQPSWVVRDRSHLES